MSFLAPFFLLGAAAIALPIIFHLIRRTTREKQVFSSLMFLAPSPPKVTKRSRLENIFLLILRCLAFCLLAIGFSRPFLKSVLPPASEAEQGQRIMLLVDTSASMRRGDLWTQARNEAEKILRKSEPADQVAVILFDRSVHSLVTLDQWKTLGVGERVGFAMSALSKATPGWSATHLGNALVSAADTLNDTAKGVDAGKLSAKKHIYLISDFQEGSKLDVLQAYEWPKTLELTPIPVKLKKGSNAGVQPIGEKGDVALLSPDAGQKVRVSNSSDAQQEQFKIGWAAAGSSKITGTPMDVYVPPGQSRSISAPPLIAGVPADHIVLQGDEYDFDNSAFIVPDQTNRTTILYLSNEEEKDTAQPLFYLKQAFQQTRQLAVQIDAVKPAVINPAYDIRATTLIVASDASGAETSLKKFLADGKTVLFLMKSPEAAVPLGKILAIPSLAAEEAKTDGYAMLRDIDFLHPIFAAFSDPRFSDFTKIHFWKHRKIEAEKIPGSRVVARFDDGAPALIEADVGKGKLLLLTAGWQSSDSQLALSSKFVPLLYAVLEHSGGVQVQPSQWTVDDPVLLPRMPGVTNEMATIRKPGGKTAQIAWGATFNEANEPGIYTVLADQTTVRRFAVNVDPSESRTAPLAMDELERLGLPIKPHDPQMAAKEADKKRLAMNTELESRQKLWRWLIIASLLVLIAETAIAAIVTRRGVTGESAPSA